MNAVVWDLKDLTFETHETCMSRFQDEVASQFDTTVKVIKESLQTIRGNLQMSSSLQGLLMSTLTKDMFLMIK